MSEKVGHVASALDKAIRAWLGDTGDWLLSEHLDDDDAKRFLDGLARAAIEAMREPTWAMTDNAKRLVDRPGFTHYDAAFVWRWMSAAALVSERGAEE